MLEQRLTELAAFTVEGADRKMLEIEIDAIAEQKHLRERQQQRDHQAARVAPDLQNLLDRNGLEPAQLHAAMPPLGQIDGDELHENVLKRGMDALDPSQR